MVIKVKYNGEWVKIPYLSTGGDSGIGYVEEAPKNGQQYTRKDGAWTVLNIPNVNADWNAVEGDAQILNKPTLATVATSGQYSDLTGIPSLSNVATSGSYNDLSDKPTIITSEEVDQKINTAVGSVYRVKGTVANYAALPTTDVVVGDVYNLEDTGANYVATSTTPTWDKLSETVDLSAYSTTAQNDEKYQPKGNYSTSFADEEDITVDENNLLKFKDKEYSPKDYSGMGRKVLRKHYVNGVNTLTQHMINKPNTIYVIQYDYCLADQTIEIPENCVLQFDGGSLSNGTIIGATTYILAKLQQIFNKNIILDGVWSNQKAYPEWYGAKRNSDSTIALNCIINNTKFNVIHLQSYVYVVTDTITISRKIIFGNIDSKINHYYGVAATIYNNSNKDTILIQYNKNTQVSDIQLYGIHLEKYGDFIYTGCGIKIVGAGFSSSFFSGVTVLTHEYGFKIELTGSYPGVSLNNILNSTFSQNKINGLYIEKIEEGNWWFNVNKFQNCYFLSNGVGGIQINNCWSTEQNEFDTCSFERNGNTLKNIEIPIEKRYGIYFKGGRGYGVSTIKNCYFEYNHSGAPTNVPSATINLQENSNVQADIIIESYLLSIVRNTFNSGLNKIIVIEDGKFSIDINTCDFKDNNYGNPGIILIKNKTDSNINDNSYISIKLNDVPKYSTTGIIQLNNNTYDFSKLGLYIYTPFNNIIKLQNAKTNVSQITHVVNASSNTINIKEIKAVGDSRSRPNGAMDINTIGFRYFDTTIEKPIYWNGTKWVDATGAQV